MRIADENLPGVWVFDLDDTLYSEIDYVWSAYRYIANELIIRGYPENLFATMQRIRLEGAEPLDLIREDYGVDLTIEELLNLYRFHQPTLSPRPGIVRLLNELRGRGHPLAVVTDGRSRTQRSKLAALGLQDNFDCVIISSEIGAEKPSHEAFLLIEQQLPGATYTYVADNVNKDFIAPNQRQWRTIQLVDDGRNIHAAPECAPRDGQPQHKVDSISALTSLALTLNTPSL